METAFDDWLMAGRLAFPPFKMTPVGWCFNMLSMMKDVYNKDADQPT